MPELKLDSLKPRWDLHEQTGNEFQFSFYLTCPWALSTSCRQTISHEATGLISSSAIKDTTKQTGELNLSSRWTKPPLHNGGSAQVLHMMKIHQILLGSLQDSAQVFL